ncbi:MAG: hypothetical protein AAGK37_21060 [Pseudomonadota bacterium]
MAKRKSNRRPKTKAPEQPSRRDMLKLVRNGGLGAAALAGTGWLGLSAVRATAAEQDLSRIGQGVPTVVQIHDPQCAMCTSLQRQTRKAMRCYAEDQLIYLVASIRTEDGAAFANFHGQPHVTLMLLDGDGEVRNVLQGVRSHDTLKPAFNRLAGVTVPA